MVEDLAARVDSYLSGGRHRTLHRLSRDSGVPYGTLRRVAQREVRSVALETAVAIMREVSTSEETLAFLERWFPESGRILREFSNRACPSTFPSRDLTDLANDYKCWLTICLAERAVGVSTASLNKLLGTRGASEAIAKLEAAEVVEWRNGFLHLKEKDFNTSGNPQFKLTELKHFCDTYDPAKKSEPGHLLATMVTGWNDEGLQLVRQTLYEVALKLAEASQDARYKGEKTCFWGVVAGTIDD